MQGENSDGSDPNYNSVRFESCDGTLEINAETNAMNYSDCNDNHSKHIASTAK